MKMNRFTMMLMVAAVISTVGCTRVGPGYVGVKVSMAGNDKGVDAVPSVTGWTFYNPLFTSVYEFPTFVQTAIWTQNPNEGDSACDKCDESITFTNQDQMQISADISLSYHFVPDKVPAFYVKFRSDNLRTFKHGFLRNLARDAFNEHAGKYAIAQIMGDNAPFLRDVKDSLQVQLTPIGVQLDQFGLVGAPRPPQGVIDAINGKVHATQLAQQKQNELVQAQADAAKAVAKAEGEGKAILAVAEAQAKANQLLNNSLTTNLLDLKRLEKWDGKLPQFSGSGATPFIQIPAAK